MKLSKKLYFHPVNNYNISLLVGYAKDIEETLE